MTNETAHNPHRLPRSVLPAHYTIELRPDLEAFTFQGSVIIDLEVVEPGSTVTLNAIELDLTEATVDAGGVSMTAASITYDEAMQRAAMEFPDALQPGAARLSIAFTGTLNDQLHGFYRSQFTDVDGQTRTIATTQFEATDARRAFPCFDEPDFKASYGVTLVVPDDLLAISNGAEVERTERGDGTVAVRFADTMKMSTYLVAFVVGPFEATAPLDVDGVPLRIVAPRGKLHLTEFALEAGAFCLRYLRDYYGIPYPGDKVDMVAIPDFAFGAMENLGCITYRETALLVDPGTATQAELLRVLDVIAHELAHMWFGDLVTMKWWDGIWLNEAFATFMEMKASAAMRPEWKRWLSFAAVERPWAYRVDSLASTRPVEFEVGSPEEANEMFDALTYGKGSAVLRMIEQFLGEEVFRQGVGTYLNRHSYDNTVTADLWAGLDEASGTDVGSIMDTWILQGGYPTIGVSVSGSSVNVTQRRHLAIPDETDQTSWKVPLAVRGETASGPFEAKILLDEPSQTINADAEVIWAIGNAGGHGFYRVSYGPDLRRAVTSRIPELDDLERFILIDDAWTFVEGGDASVADYLELAVAYRKEPEHAVWTTIVTALSAIKHHVVTDEKLPAFRGVARDVFGEASSGLGWEPDSSESSLARRLRGLLLGAMGRLADDDSTIDRSREIAEAWLAGDQSADPEVAQASLFTLAAHGDRSTFDSLEAAYRLADTPQREQKILLAMSSVDDPGAVDRALEGVLDGTIRSQDAAWVVSRLFGNRSAGEHAWAALRSSWSELTSKMPPMTLKRLIDGIPAMSEPSLAADVEAHLAETDLPGVAKAIAQNLEKLRVNVALRQRESNQFGN